MKNRILIQTNQYFTKDRWKNCLKDNFPEIVEKLVVQFATTNSELKSSLINNDICFSFHLPEIELIKHLKLMYIGISDINYSDTYSFPKDVDIYTSKGIASEIIAEHTLLLALSLIRKFPTAILNQRKNKWDQTPFLDNKVKSICNYKIGVLGLGENGKAIAMLFKKLGCWVAGYSNNEKEKSGLNEWFSLDKLEDILKICDIIVVAIPLRKDTYHLLGKKQFEIMGKGKFLINIARGEIIDEENLYFYLKHSMIKGAALDVFEKEPLPSKSKLWKLSNIIITPHIAGNIHFFVGVIQKEFFSKIEKYA